ncbi:hypothetical protein G9C85_17875 [Halorubellus sp. JP-L1]|uniref:hypothetical protein n=1 Tax=Halorubellus sp. JP-L1 TaxID=2715753 RepID=UPI0014097C43|nr:hypothetical protein [Halorubellus sp. JP-L1]NHN43490.1 hypothetical protein [Halorubellus sp. JP-L1]
MTHSEKPTWMTDAPVYPSKSSGWPVHGVLGSGAKNELIAALEFEREFDATIGVRAGTDAVTPSPSVYVGFGQPPASIGAAEGAAASTTTTGVSHLG